MSPKNRKLIFDKSGGKCWYCGCDLTGTRWQADHFYPVIRFLGKMFYPELNTIDNLVPSCAPCNNFKHASQIEGFRWNVNEQFQNVPKNSTGMRQLMRLGLVDISVKPVVFWFEEQGLSVKSEFEICGISDESHKIIWREDKQELSYFYHNFGDVICTLKHVGTHWLAIAIRCDWEELGRIEISNGRHAKLQAADWALKLIQSVEGK
jgi:hypothetical protein